VLRQNLTPRTNFFVLVYYRNMAILNYTDLERFMGKTFTDTQQEAASIILMTLENELSYYLNKPLYAQVFTNEKHMLEIGQRQIFLRNSPVRSVTAFSVGMNNQMVNQVISDFDIYPWGIDNVRIAGQGYIALVTYTAGVYDSDSVVLERVLFTASAREMSKFLADAQGLERLNVEGTDYVFGNKGESGFTEQELKMISRLKRRIVR